MPVAEKKNGFLSGVFILTASAAAVKLIGVFYKIPLVSLVGIEGMAYFLAAYNIYTLLFTVSNAGLPVAVSLLVSKSLARGDKEGAERIFYVAFRLFFTVGALFCAATYFFADFVAASIKMPEAAISVRAIAPALLFTSLSGAFRGYFQGRGVMRPTAISQVIESLGKLGFGLLFCKIGLMLGAGCEQAAALAIAGVSAGTLLSAAYLFILRKREKIKLDEKKGRRKTLSELMKISAPITVGAAVMSLSGLVDTALVSSRLQAAGFSAAEANSMYSSFGNLAVPLFALVPAFVSPIAISVAPMLAGAVAGGDKKQERAIFSSAFRLCALIAIPAAFGLAAFSHPILNLLYPSQTEGAQIAAPMLSLLAPAALFSCLVTVTNALLQAYSKERLPIFSAALGILLKIGLEYFLISNENIGVFGAPIGTLACDVLIVFLNLCFLCGRAKISPKPSDFFSPLAAAAAATALAVPFYGFLMSAGVDSRVALILVIFFDALIYAILAVGFGVIGEDELKLLPRGEKIIKIMKKLRLLRNDNEQRRKNKLSQKP